MIQNVSSNTAVLPLVAQTNAAPAAKNAPQEKTVTKNAVPSVQALDAQAWMLRQQVGASLYDRSFTLREGERALKRMEAVEAYANEIFSKDGGPTARDLRRLANKLNNAEKMLDRLATNNRGIDLDSIEAIDGRDIDVVQANLADRIRHGLADGSLTEAEAKSLTDQQEQLAQLETKFRETDGKLTGGEMKQVMDQLRKAADAINQARNNGNGVNLGTYSYADAVNDRQAALEKQLQDGLKAGSLTELEAEQVRKQFEVVNQEEASALQNGRVDWREWTNLSTSMNNAEILLYDLQRNTDGKQLADSYVDVVNVDKRQAQQLEGLTRGIDNGALTNEEAISLLDIQQAIQMSENKLVRDGLTRSEYLRLQNQMNDYSLTAADLAGNADRYDGVVPRVTLPPVSGGPTQPPAPPAPPVAGEPATPPAPPAPPVAAEPATPPAPPAPPVAAEPATPPKADEAKATETKATETKVTETKATEVKLVTELNDDEKVAAAYQEAMRRAAGAYGDIRDRFAEWMTQAMKETDGRVREGIQEYLDKVADDRRESNGRSDKADDYRRNNAVDERGRGASDDRPGVTPTENRNAEVAAQVNAYAAKGSTPLVTLQKKVA